jgi:hypothetical protein
MLRKVLPFVLVSVAVSLAATFIVATIRVQAEEFDLAKVIKRFVGEVMRMEEAQTAELPETEA